MSNENTGSEDIVAQAEKLLSEADAARKIVEGNDKFLDAVYTAISLTLAASNGSVVTKLYCDGMAHGIAMALTACDDEFTKQMVDGFPKDINALVMAKFINKGIQETMREVMGVENAAD